MTTADLVRMTDLAGERDAESYMGGEPAGMDRHGGDPGHQGVGEPDARAGAGAHELRPTSAAAFAGVPVVPREWVARDLIPARDVTILSGDGAVGKSLLGLQLCWASASGGHWIGMEVSSGKALFLTAEDDLQEVHRRLAAISINTRVRLDDVHDLHIETLAGRDAVMAAPDGSKGSLLPTPLFRQMEALIAREGYGLVLLDTLADLFGGDEINRAHARQFIGLLRSIALRGPAIVLLAHPSQSGMSRGDGASGSTAWSNSARGRLYLTRPKPEVGDDTAPDADRRLLQVMKANYGPAAVERSIRWQEGVFVPDGPGITRGVIGASLQAQHAENVFMAIDVAPLG